MTCSERYATAQQFSDFWCTCSDLDADAIAAIEARLNDAAGTINLILNSVGACDCTHSSESAAVLRQLNMIIAAAFQKCPCGSAKLTPEEQQGYLDWANGILESLRLGETSVCQGDTGAAFPAMSVAEVNYGPNEGTIRTNDILRNS